MSDWPITPCGVQLEKGQRWIEKDGRFTRIVTVIGYEPVTQSVLIRCVRNAKARLDRFTGKPHGYELVR